MVVAGDFQTDAVHAAAKAINDALGNTGATVLYGTSIEAAPAGAATAIADLTQAIEAGQVELLVIMGGNPAFTAPVDLRFAERLVKVPLVVYHSTHVDETAPLSHWHIPETHPLESWGDARSFDGTVTLMQPLIEPLYEGQSPHDFLAAFTAAARAARRSPSSRTTGRRPTAPDPAAGRSRIRAARPSRTPTRSGARHCTTDSSPARA